MVLEPVPGVNGRMLRPEASGLNRWELVESASIKMILGDNTPFINNRQEIVFSKITKENPYFSYYSYNFNT